MAALKVRRQQQHAARDQADDGWIETGLVFTTRYGTPIEPRNFTRSFDRRRHADLLGATAQEIAQAWPLCALPHLDATGAPGDSAQALSADMPAGGVDEPIGLSVQHPE